MFVIARIRDAVKAAWRVLIGQSESQLEVLRIKREWQGVELEVGIMFDNVNALIARLSKRQKRESTKAAPVADPEQPPEPLLPGLEPMPANGKAAIRARIRSAQKGKHAFSRIPEE